MAVHFHSLRVKNIKKETDNCVSIAFEVPPELQEQFQFTHGQNITIKAIIDGEELRRSYSICSTPFEMELKVAVKKVDGGKFSAYANEYLKAGDLLQVMPPTGKFNTALDPENKKQYLAFAAGSGITPIISIIKTILKTELNSSFTLVYSNQSRSSIIFFEELEGLKNKYLQRFNFIHLLSREKTDASINFGRISTEKLKALSSLLNYKNTDEFFICGPEEMIFCVKDFLIASGITTTKIHFELFTVPGQKGVAIQNKGNTDSGLKSIISIKLDGRTIEFDLAFDNDCILDAALKQGIDLPFACKGGVCATCRAKLLEGEVSMKVNYALEPEEVAQGFILTCQSQPLTKKILIDFDIK